MLIDESKTKFVGELLESLREEENKKKENKRKFENLVGEDGEVKAKYKIEVSFTGERSLHTHFPGSVFVYRNASALNGDGDELLYPCPDDNCKGYLEPEHIMPEFAVCPVCYKKWTKIEDFCEGRFFRLTTQMWAEVIHKAFMRLNCDADIYLKFHPEDLREKSLIEQMKDKRGDEYLKNYKNRVYVIYSLKNIIKDSQNGKDLYKLFLNFVRA